MYTLAQIIHVFLPLIAIYIFALGIRKNNIHYIISTLWISIISLMVMHQISDGEIIGVFFNYYNAALYSINLIVLFISLIRIISHLSTDNSIFKYTNSLIKSFIVIGSLLVIANIWINAIFIENKKDGTPVMHVALVHKPAYCSSRYILYKVERSGALAYMCPNHYGLIPSIGHLPLKPDFISTNTSIPNEKQMLLLPEIKSS